jgi:hypothetical protein
LTHPFLLLANALAGLFGFVAPFVGDSGSDGKFVAIAGVIGSASGIQSCAIGRLASARLD